MRGDAHVRFGGRAEETDRPKDRHRASARPLRLARPSRARRAVPLKGSRVVVLGRLQQRTWTAEDGHARSVVEVVAEELGASLRWATATTTRTTRSQAR
jgi:hypothetical protein